MSDPINHPVEPHQRDYAFIYAKLSRHVAAADVRLIVGQHNAARLELEAALIAIKAFETTLFTVTTDD